MSQDGTFTILLIVAGALGVLGTVAVALMSLNGIVGIAGVAGLLAFLAGFVAVILASAGGSNTTRNWVVRCLVPVPMAVIVFFVLRAFGV